jgi:Mg2+/citrate symporter
MNMWEFIRLVLLIIIAVILFGILGELKMVNARLSRIWDILPKRVGDEFPD